MTAFDPILSRLSEASPRRVPGARLMRRAAVAVVLHRGEEGGQLLMIQRAEREGDPWSGHMALPGGRHDPEDENTFETALRETREELDLDLAANGRCVGKLSHILASARGLIKKPLVVSPFVFTLDHLPDLNPNEEVADVLHIPLAFLLDPSNRETMSYRVAGARLKLPCYRFDGRTIWGLSLKIIDELLALD